MTLVLTKRMVKSEKHTHPQPKPLESIDTYIQASINSSLTP